MNLTPLKYLIFIENVTTVFRNYRCLKRCARIIVILWVVFETINIFIGAAINLSYENKFHFTAPRIYFFSSAAFSVYVMIASLYYSKIFHSLLANFDWFYKNFADESYNRRMLRMQRGSTLVVALICSLLTVTFTYARVSKYNGKIRLASYIMLQYVDTTSDFRYIFQYFILRGILFVLAEQLKAITRSIDNEISKIIGTQANVENPGNLSSAPVNYEKLTKWVKAYENISDSSNLCKSMFSIQLTIMLLIVTAYYIILLYSIAIVTVGGTATWASLFPNLLLTSVFLGALIVISLSGQHIQNNYMELRQKICELCVHTLENEEYYKLTKDLLRYVRTRPVRVHVFGTLEVNMSMLPAIVGLFTTYTVIILQFNNVL